MNRFRLSALIIALVAVLLSAMPALAITPTIKLMRIVNNGDTPLDFGSYLANFSTQTLVDEDKLGSDGLDARLTSVSGGDPLPMMLTNNKVLTVASLTGYGTASLYFTTAHDPATSMPIIVGNLGYFTTADNPAIELGSVFTLTIVALFDTTYETSIHDYILDKDKAFRIYIYDDQTVRAAILDSVSGAEICTATISGVDTNEHTIVVSGDGSNLSIAVDGGDPVLSEEPIGEGVPDNSNPTTWGTHNVMPYINQIHLTLGSGGMEPGQYIRKLNAGDLSSAGSIFYGPDIYPDLITEGGSGYIYFINYGSTINLVELDTATMTETSTLDLASYSDYIIRGLYGTPTTLYVAASGPNSNYLGKLWKFNTSGSTMSLTNTYTFSSGGPRGNQICSDGTYIYTPLDLGGATGKIYKNAMTNLAKVDEVTIDDPESVTLCPEAVTCDATYLYAKTNHYGLEIEKFDLTTLTYLSTFPSTGAPQAGNIFTTGGYVFGIAKSTDPFHIFQIDTSDMSTYQTFSSDGEVTYITIAPSGGPLWATGEVGLYKINSSTLELMDTLEGSYQFGSISSDGTYVYALYYALEGGGPPPTVLDYSPQTIIQGNILPDLAGNQDAEIHWGTNGPADTSFSEFVTPTKPAVATPGSPGAGPGIGGGNNPITKVQTGTWTLPSLNPPLIGDLINSLLDSTVFGRAFFWYPVALLMLLLAKFWAYRLTFSLFMKMMAGLVAVIALCAFTLLPWLSLPLFFIWDFTIMTHSQRGAL